MRLALFFVVNLAAAIGFGVLANAQGYGPLGVAVVVIGVLTVIQLAYVIWLVAVSKVDRTDASENSPDGYVTTSGRRLSEAQGVPGKHAR